MDKIKVYFDGACEPNPGEMGIGGVAYDSNGKKIFDFGKPKGRGTSNIAEYMAAIEALKMCQEFGLENITLYGDSRLVVNAIKGLWKAKSKHLIPLAEQAQKLFRGIKGATAEWIPRENNVDADYMSTLCLEQYAGSTGFQP